MGAGEHLDKTSRNMCLVCRIWFLNSERAGRAFWLTSKSRACLLCSLLCLESSGIPWRVAASCLNCSCGLHVSFRMPSRKQQALHSRAFSHSLSLSQCFGAGLGRSSNLTVFDWPPKRKWVGHWGREHRPKFRDGMRRDQDQQNKSIEVS